jgi:hypothetical protein
MDGLRPRTFLKIPLVAQGHTSPLSLIFLINNGIREKIEGQIRGYEGLRNGIFVETGHATSLRLAMPYLYG